MRPIFVQLSKLADPFVWYDRQSFPLFHFFSTSLLPIILPISSLYLCIHLFFFFLWRYSHNLGLGLPPWNSPFHFGLLDLRQLVGLLGRVITSSQGLYLYTNRKTHARTPTHKHTLNIHALSRIRTPIPASEREKTVHALDRWATVTGLYIHLLT
jgi:hypothetical protein